MAQKSWYLNRRDLLKGAGIALALPSLHAMGTTSALANVAKTETPKRMMIGYIAYGTYMPNGASGIPRQKNSGEKTPHHDWSWWPCKDAGELTFNKSSQPFKELKDYVTYLRGLDHEGGWKMGGHSSGDVFATGADMTETQKTNSISIDQVAANMHGHKTRYS
jgi:hypothetical protein